MIYQLVAKVFLICSSRMGTHMSYFRKQRCELLTTDERRIAAAPRRAIGVRQSAREIRADEGDSDKNANPRELASQSGPRHSNVTPIRLSLRQITRHARVICSVCMTSVTRS